MKKLTGKQIVLLCLLVLGLTLATCMVHKQRVTKVNSALSDAYVSQKIKEVKNKVQEQTALYYGGKLIGVVNDVEAIDALVEETYHEKYEERFPNSSLSLGIDIHEQPFYSLQTYENKDEEIFAFIKAHDLFSIEATQVSYSNGSVLYILDENEYKKAKDMFEQSFVLEEETKEDIYGRIIKDNYLKEKEAVSKGYAPITMVLKNKDEILDWLYNGYSVEKKTYIVEDGDTIQGAASKNALMTIELLALNRDVLIDANQLLEAGMKLDVSGIQPPIHYVVEKEATIKVAVYPDSPQYIEDDTMPLGTQRIEQEEKLGYKKDVVKEIYVNGTLDSYEVISSEEIEAPQRRIVRQGTKKKNNYVQNAYTYNKNFRYPTYNAVVTCGWGCYSGHQAMDVANLYKRYGEVLASEGGTVITNSFNYVNGYYMLIDHGSGFITYYGHMNQPGFAQVGEYVYRGQVIGQIGETGVATGPHIHFEIRYKGQKMDPALYVR